MRIYRVPDRIHAFLLDIDGTLYTHPEYVRFQSECLIRELALTRGSSYEECLALVNRVRADYAAANDGATTSLGNIMARLGIPIATSIAWRSRLIVPSCYLSTDTVLRQALVALQTLASPPGTPGDSGTTRISLVAVTNNPRSVGVATLEALGVEDLFLRVVGLDDTMQSKPAEEPYRLAASIAGASNTSCVSIGDRYDVDLAVPLKLGMGAILVDGVQDLYALPGALALA
ncbi:MAG: HAD family hydrolase [Spirochaetia bacterium]|jgi:phosphoglycolate phosphatase/putative hydrolase of the HAD superfamily|nr:HAD family hydrolase [Spirochaetia bacterium]